jgi:two-component system, response regulator RegA
VNGRSIDRILLVEDDAALAASLREAFAADAEEIRACDRARDVAALVDGWTPDLVILDVVLAEGDAFDVLATLRSRSPRPLIVAVSGAATATQAFRLAELGVQAYVEKPFSIGALRGAIRQAAAEPPDLEPRVRAQVGLRAIGEVTAQVRKTMVEEAMARAGGSRRNAAKLLKISRQLLQYILRPRAR